MATYEITTADGKTYEIEVADGPVTNTSTPMQVLGQGGMAGPVSRLALAQARAQSAGQPTPPPDPGLDLSGLKGLGQGVLDVARTPYDLGKAALMPAITPQEHLADFATGPAGLLVQRTIIGPAQDAWNRAAESAKAGDPYGAVFHGAAALTPIAGPAAEQTFDQASQGDTTGAAFRAAGNTLAGLALSRLIPKGGTPESRINKLTSATGGSAGTDIPALYRRVLDDLDTTANAVGRPKNVKELTGLVDTTLTNLDNEFDIALHPISGNQIVPTQVAGEIRAPITPNMLKTPRGQRMARLLNARATDFESQPWTWGELNHERMQATARLRGFHDQSGTGQSATLKTQADAIADKAIENATKDMIYGELERTYNRPRYFTELKRKQSALLQLKDQLEERGATLATKSAEIKGAPLFSQMGASMYGHPEHGRIGTSLHRVQTIIPGLRPNPELNAAKSVQGAFSGTPPTPPWMMEGAGVAGATNRPTNKKGKTDSKLGMPPTP